ncbi:response regulator transcription factor [Umezawaea sp. NPDC059074]|uniref:response regulator transcription factor n=1 Tax=Umezawaea sp. NPDC059074 TaxID=3346716 RepID=UPI003679204E
MSEPAKILVVEDSPRISYLIELALGDARLDVWAVGDGTLSVARERASDVVLLALGLPAPDGVEVCRRLRGFSNAYVLMLTGRAEEVDKLIGCRSARTTTSRSRSRRWNCWPVCRPCWRGRPENAGPVEIDPLAREVWVNGAAVELTRIELDLLAALIDNARQVHTRDQLRERPTCTCRT